ncbi:helix-turn-helix domain-containing protein [Viridibacillus sp. FSL R5-0888]|uniref:helix-turn-helix domain-containing protein n=1 Tax=Viridibacillus sp. FSL R5-0888 TaxID=2921663 RepID=UPI0030FC35DE
MQINDIQPHFKKDASDNSYIEKLTKQFASKIDNFFVLYIPEQNEQSIDYESLFNHHQMHGQIFKIQAEGDALLAKTFIIKEAVYQKNEEVFLNLRLKARDEMVAEIAKNIMFYLLAENDPSHIKSHPILTNSSFIEEKLLQLQNSLKANSFLAESSTWENFYSWFRLQLIEWMLEEIELFSQVEEFSKLDDRELNEMFYSYLSTNFSENTEFVERTAQIVNVYVQQWAQNIINEIRLGEIEIPEIESSIHQHKGALEAKGLLISKRRDFAYNFMIHNHLFVMNSAPYQAVREAIFKKVFRNMEQSPWPTTKINKGNTEGVIQIIPKTETDNQFPNPNVTTLQEAWHVADSLTDVDVDVFDALCGIFLSRAKHNEEMIEIELNDLLALRGLKPKLGGEGRRGGFEAKQKEQILKSLTNIQSIWLSIDKATIYEKGKPVQIKMQGRTFIFKDEHGEEYSISEKNCARKITFTIDQVFAKYLNGSSRQVALLSMKALQYHPYKQLWEKRLSRYFSWRWRTQARKGSFLQPNKIHTLLESIGEKVNVKTPSRTRERFEKALDTLLEDGVIASWHYEKWDEAIADYKGWSRMWLNASVLIEPPEIIKDHYRSIEKKQKGRNKEQQLPLIPNGPNSQQSLGERLKKCRKSLQLTLFQVAEALEISPSYVSNIERTIITPSAKIRKKIINWLDIYET